MERSDKRLVSALGVALGCALLAIAFLLGRISAKPAVVTVAASPPSVATPESVPPLEPPLEKEPVFIAAAPQTGNSPLATTEPAGFPVPGREIASTPPPAVGAPGATLPDRQQIAAYFNQVDRLEDMGVGDPQAFATSLLQSMSSGDFSGFDDLLAKARAQRQRLQSIAPPRACLEHHRLALALSADSVAMLERLKAALMKGDSTALLTIATEGRTLETQANQLKSMGDTIKRQSGN